MTEEIIAYTVHVIHECISGSTTENCDGATVFHGVSTGNGDYVELLLVIVRDCTGTVSGHLRLTLGVVGEEEEECAPQHHAT